MSRRHNASLTACLRLAECQAGDLAPECADVHRRFWAKAVEAPSGCWEWQGSRNKFGYGQFTWAARAGRQRPINSHRLAWEFAHGPIVDGLWVLHHCDNPACINPAHLFLGNHTTNMRDAARKGRLSVPRPRAQMFTDEQVGEMRNLSRVGMRQVDIAAKFGCSRAYVCLLLGGKRRTHPSVDGARGSSLRRVS